LSGIAQVLSRASLQQQELQFLFRPWCHNQKGIQEKLSAPLPRIGVTLGWSFYRTMTEHTLAAEIVRLQKLDLNDQLRGKIEEAAELLAEGRYMEAEALVQNADARVRHAGRTVAGSVGM
jgi:hypothetical protein